MNPEQVFSDPGVSYWLRDSLAKAWKLDPLDAAKDAEVLAAILKQRATDTLKAQRGMLQWLAKLAKHRG